MEKLLIVIPEEEIKEKCRERFSNCKLKPEILAWRAIKWFKEGMPPLSGRMCCLDAGKDTDILEVFIKRLNKLGIKIELCGNYPWIYIDKINGRKVKEKFKGNHGFTIAFMPIRKGQKMEFTDIGEIFCLIRKYVA